MNQVEPDQEEREAMVHLVQRLAPFAYLALRIDPATVTEEEAVLVLDWIHETGRNLIINSGGDL